MAALAASFQPANAATRTGERSSGGSANPVQCLHGSERSGTPVRPDAGRVRDRGSRSARGGARSPRDPPRGRRAAPGTALRGSLRVRAQGPADVARRVGLPLASTCATAAARSRRARSATPTGSACASSAGDAIAVRGKVERYRGELVAEVDDARRLEPGSFDPGDFLPAAYRSVEELEGFLEHLTREIADPALRGGGRAARLHRARWPTTSAARPAPARRTTPTSAACSSTRSRSRPWSARLCSSASRGSTRTC